MSFHVQESGQLPQKTPDAPQGAFPSNEKQSDHMLGTGFWV
jgi:hypothetical protein